jgi:hypothetical protein
MNDEQKSIQINSNTKLNVGSDEATFLNTKAEKPRTETKEEFYKKIRDYRRESIQKAEGNLGCLKSAGNNTNKVIKNICSKRPGWNLPSRDY